MLRLKESWYNPVTKDLSEFFYNYYYRPLLELFEEPIYNSRSAVISALRKGIITYNDGIFSGKFNISMSRDLSKYATFDRRSGIWKGNPPNDVLAASVIANDKSKNLHLKINDLIDDMETNISSVASQVEFNISDTFESMDTEIKADLNSIGIVPEMSFDIQENLRKDYTESQQLNIVNWNDKQIINLRKVVEKSALEGYRKNSLIELIKNEWNVTHNKAKFLARQETSLYMSKLRRERNLDAGVNKYKWSTSHDERVRPSNKAQRKSGADHRHLNGTIQTYGNPPIVNVKTGKRAEPGEDYNCRCVAIGIID